MKLNQGKQIRMKPARNSIPQNESYYQDHLRFRYLDEPYDLQSTSILLANEHWSNRSSDYWIQFLFDFLLDLSKKSKAEFSIGVAKTVMKTINTNHIRNGIVEVKYTKDVSTWIDYKKRLFFKEFVVPDYFEQRSLMVFCINRNTFSSFKVVLYQNGIQIISGLKYDAYRQGLKSKIYCELEIARLLE